MILLVNPRATKPRHRRFPLSVMALGAALPPGESWEIWDGNRPGHEDPGALVQRCEAIEAQGDPLKLFAVTAMPGPQLPRAVEVTMRLKERFPRVPVVWGGYFPSLYPGPVVNASYVDWAVRGQGERPFRQLLEVLDGGRDPATVAGLMYRDGGEPRLNPEAPWVGPNELPPPPYDHVDVADYLEPTFLGERCGVYQASIGCPYTCSFCGVIGTYGSREKWESPERTVAHLSPLVTEHGMDGLHFYDSNFFQAEAHAREICERLTALRLSWWCEARVDVVLRYPEATWRTMARSGLRMIFFGAESGSDEVLARMSKGITTAQTLEVAERCRAHGIVPEFSFVLGGPDDPEAEIETTLRFARRLKDVNAESELIFYFYTPTPQRGAAYGGVDPLSGTPERLEDWTRPEWVDWMTHEAPDVPWMTPRLRERVLEFERSARARFPSIHDGDRQLYGHLRPAEAG